MHYKKHNQPVHIHIFRLSKNTQIRRVMKIRPVGAKLLHGDRRDEYSSRFSQYWERA